MYLVGLCYTDTLILVSRRLNHNIRHSPISSLVSFFSFLLSYSDLLYLSIICVEDEFCILLAQRYTRTHSLEVLLTGDQPVAETST